MKTRAEIDKLILDWRDDPCWELEDTEGFEDHRTELLGVRMECEAITGDLEGVLRLTLPWIPRPVWPEWCRRAYAIKAGMLVHADGSAFRAQLGKSPPVAMIE